MNDNEHEDIQVQIDTQSAELIVIHTKIDDILEMLNINNEQKKLNLDMYSLILGVILMYMYSSIDFDFWHNSFTTFLFPSLSSHHMSNCPR